MNYKMHIEMKLFEKYSTNVKYILPIIFLLILVLVFSMTYQGVHFSNPKQLAIAMAASWRICLSLCCLTLFYEIDSFFNNYNHLLYKYIKHWNSWSEIDRKVHLDQLLTGGGSDRCSSNSCNSNSGHRVHAGVITEVNQLCYTGFLLSCITLIFFYTILYCFEYEICHDLKLVMYCAVIYLTCSTYFLLRLCELTKMVNLLDVDIKAHVKIKIKIFHWEPSGDILVGNALGLLFIVFSNVIKIYSHSC
jgi:hypothetical protein